MSTPSVTILKNLVLNWKSNQMEEETIATFYRHWDGYPSCHAIDIANSLVVASRTKPEHIDFSGASVERGILNNRNWCQHFLKAMCMADADIEFIGEDNVPSASYTYVVTGAYDNFGGKVSIGAVGVRPREDARITDTMNLFKWFMGKRKRYKLVDAADHIGYEWTGRAHGSLADALATLAVQRWLEQWLVAE